MKITSKIKPDGYLKARFRESDKKPWKDLWEIPVKNLIVAVGRAQVALLIGDGAGVVFGWGGIGTGTDAAVDGDEALQTEVDRQAVAFSRVTITTLNDTAQYVTTHEAPAGGWVVTEYVLVNAAVAGVILNRVVFGAINLAEGNQLEMTYKCQVT